MYTICKTALKPNFFFNAHLSEKPIYIDFTLPTGNWMANSCHFALKRWHWLKDLPLAIEWRSRLVKRGSTQRTVWGQPCVQYLKRKMEYNVYQSVTKFTSEFVPVWSDFSITSCVSGSLLTGEILMYAGFGWLRISSSLSSSDSWFIMITGLSRGSTTWANW